MSSHCSNFLRRWQFHEVCIEFCGHLTNDFFVILSFYGDFQTITKGPFAILYDAPFGFHKKTIQIISRRPCHISMKNDLSIFWISINTGDSATLKKCDWFITELLVLSHFFLKQNLLNIKDWNSTNFIL